MREGKTGHLVVALTRFTVMSYPRTESSKKRVQRLMTAFSRQLRSAMDVAGIQTQQELVIRSGIEISSISKFLSGKKLPTLEHIAMLAKGLGCSARELVPASIVEALLGTEENRGGPKK